MAAPAICVTTRRAWRVQQQELETHHLTPSPPHHHLLHHDTSCPPASSPDSLSPPSSPLTDASELGLPSPSRDTSVSTSSSSKRHRTPSLVEAPRIVARPRKIKKWTSTSTYASRSPSRCESRQRSVALDEPIYRSDRSRSTSVFPTPVNFSARDWWSADDGSTGDGFVSSADVVHSLAKSYKSYFRNLDDPDDKSFEAESLPTADLEYPNNYANEKFILLVPKDKDHYNPVMCLEQSLYTIIDSYLTAAQKVLFGSSPSESIPEDTPPPSPSLITSLASSDGPHAPDVPPEPPNPPQPRNEATRPDYLRLFQRAIRRHDGPLLLSTLESMNQLLRSLKYPPLPSDVFLPAPPNVLMSAVHSWTHPRGIPDRVMLRIVDETYQREVYGELMPSFTSDIIAATGLNSSSLLMDLGSGVGNVLLQASLQTGCRSYGIELLEGPAKVARQQWKQFQKRCRMWGVRTGSVELEQGDMLKSTRVSELMREADVVLVNNKVFQQSLNEALRAKFLDLKEGAIVVSLKPFVSPNARVTERNVDDICAIFDVVERPYRSGSVSWGSGGGTYYLHRVDRVGYANVKQRFENLRARGARRR